MKKVKYFIFSLICLFSCSMVFAENEVVIKSITPSYDESSSVIIANDDNKYNITFNDLNQVVKYNVVIENTTEKELKVSEIDITKPSTEFLIYQIEGIKVDDIIKGNDTKEFIVSLQTSSNEDLRESFEEKLVTIMNFENAVENPFTSTKGLIVILIAATLVAGGCIIIYRNNKFARYTALVIMFISIIPNVKAVENISISLEINAKYSANFDWSNTTVTFVGDSITNSYGTTKSYYQYLDETLDFKTLTIMSANGSTISSQSDYGTTRSPLINRYQNIPKSDLVVIFMGTNDYGHETPLGKITDDTDVSFYGAFNVVISELQKSHPNSVIVLATPIHRYGYGTSGILGTKYTYDNIPNGRGYTLEDYANAIKDIANKYNLPLIDLFTQVDIDPTDPTDRTKYIPDGVHPNEDGHKIIAEVMDKALLDIKPPAKNTDEDEASNVEIELMYGNDFYSSSQWYDDKSRLSTTKNIYLKEGTIIYLKDPTVYNFAIYKQTAEVMVQGTGIAASNGWTPQNIIIPEDGYYGISIKKVNSTEFDLTGTDSKYISHYVGYEKIKMQLGIQYYEGYLNHTNRISLTRNVYLKKGTIITINDKSTYMLGVFAQSSYDITLKNEVLQTWTTSDYTVTTDGWYGLGVKRVDDADFTFGSTDSEYLSSYITFN